MNKFLYFLSLFVVSSLGYSQVKSSWKEVGLSQKAVSQKQEDNLGLEQKLVYTLNETEFKQSLESLHSRTSDVKNIIVVIPNSLGKMEQFRVVESSNFAPQLQAQYPKIRAYSGTGITDSKASISFSVSPSGIQTMVLRGDSGSEFIDPLVKNKSIYVVSTSKNRSKGVLPLSCKTVDVTLNKDLIKKTGKLKSNNGVFKTMRLALSCTGEYTQYFGGTKLDALAAMNATMARVNGVFNKDLALKLEIIANNTDIIYIDPVTDPYSNPTDGSKGAWNLELQSNLTSTIGSGSYDIGHLFGDSGGGGDAGCIGCVCVDPTPSDQYAKGSAYTSPSNGKPEGDSFDIDYVAHEMGHQLGANHTFSYDIEDTGVNVEPGSGSTIMGYAGITDYDVQNQSDDYFTYASILQIQENLATKSCPSLVPLTNQTPTVNAGSDYVIPKSTAFVLKGTGSDPNGNTMTYCWEQNDSATANETGANSLAYGVKPKGPNFRSFLPSSTMNRYLPVLSKVLAGQLSTSWESVSSVGRNLNFVFTGRDNAVLGSGQTNSDAMLVTVDGNKGPFAVTSQNSSDFGWNLGSSQTITWSVNGTGSLAGSANVNIRLSTDGGLTFPIILATNTPNDGSEVVTAPTTAFKICRILIEPTGNIFYAVNSTPFTVGYSVASSCNSYPFATPYPILESQTYTEKTIVVPDTGSEISDVNFEIGFTHAFLSDLQIEVVSPKGTVVKLFNGECGGTNSSLILKYDDLGGQLSCGTTSLQTVAPAQVLSAFNGENPAGTWTLRARDLYVGDTGKIDSATIDICSQIFTLATPELSYLDGGLIMSPNPSKGDFDIQFVGKPENGLVKVVIYDFLGNKVFQKEYENKLVFKETIHLEAISSGVYIVTVSDNERDDVGKIVIQ
jgi:subtilisin-like proprotein convertase family protein